MSVDWVTRLAERDPYLAALGMEVRDGGPGFATVAMRVGSEHLSFNGTCHGGALFSLADTAFGLASNSHGTVAAGIDTHMMFARAVREGDVVVATATEETRSRRVASYRVMVTREPDELVATFTGTVAIIDEAHRIDTTRQQEDR